jgi:hypothetical protein
VLLVKLQGSSFQIEYYKLGGGIKGLVKGLGLMFPGRLKSEEINFHNPAGTLFYLTRQDRTITSD